MQLRRSQLYELAWTVPKEFIAATVGVSGSAVGKTCRKYQIPVPGRGDWQKLRKGQSIHRPPLPEPEKDRVVPVEIEESRYLELTQGAAATHMRELQTAEPDAATIVTETRQSTEHTATSQPKAGLQPEARPREVTARPTGQDPYPMPPPQTFSATANGTEHGWDPRVVADVQQLSKLMSEHSEALRNVELLIRTKENIDSAASPVLRVWCLLARQTLQKHDPIASLAKECRLIAQGKNQPSWWVEPDPDGS